MKVFAEPTGIFSRAMVRVADALARHSPPNIRFTTNCLHCDLQVLHVISADAIPYTRDLECKYAIIQYCTDLLRAGSMGGWGETWRNAEVVWSYYDLIQLTGLRDGIRHVMAPLGIDKAFTATYPASQSSRENLVVTSGYVSAPNAEAIEEVWRAADILNYNVIHVGPRTVDGTCYRPRNIEYANGVSDEQLAAIYNRALWVSGLRHVEGFELPAAEGLACGARPLLFPHLHSWYGDLGYYVEESHGDKLVNSLCEIMKYPPCEMTADELEKTLATFNWQLGCDEFWAAVAQGKLAVPA